MENTSTFNELVKGVNAKFADVFDENQYAYKPFVGGMIDGKLEKPQVPLFDTVTTENAEDHFISVSSVGYMRPTSEGSSINYTERALGYRKNLYQQEYTNGIIVSYKQILFGDYQDKLDAMMSLAKSAQKTKDLIAFLGIYGSSNNANTSLGIGDGVALASTAHPRKDGGATQSNYNAALSLSETNLETARIAIAYYNDNKGNLITASGEKPILLVPTALEKLAMIICNGEFRSNTTNNDINIYDGNITVVATPLIGAGASYTFADGTVVTGSDTASFLVDPGTFKPKFSIGQDVKFDKTQDFDNKNMKYSVLGFYGFGPRDWRGLYRLNA